MCGVTCQFSILHYVAAYCTIVVIHILYSMAEIYSVYCNVASVCFMVLDFWGFIVFSIVWWWLDRSPQSPLFVLCAGAAGCAGRGFFFPSFLLSLFYLKHAFIQKEPSRKFQLTMTFFQKNLTSTAWFNAAYVTFPDLMLLSDRITFFFSLYTCSKVFYWYKHATTQADTAHILFCLQAWSSEITVHMEKIGLSEAYKGHIYFVHVLI